MRPLLETLEHRLAPAVVTPFPVRSSANVTGDIAIIANTLGDGHDCRQLRPTDLHLTDL
jgi:hypothetical protein